MSKKVPWKFGPNQRKWLRALKSGKYTQGKGYLHINDGKDEIDKFCCLGVLCSVLKIPTTDKIKYGTYDVFEYNYRSGVLPVEACASVKLFQTDGNSKNCDLNNLPYYNDKLGWNFTKIANHLKKYREYYFSGPA
jgi:hypothetical protein